MFFRSKPSKASPAYGWRPYLSGAVAAWCAAWLLYGLRVIPVLMGNPLPWTRQIKITPVLVAGTAQWVGSALAIYAGLGFLFAGAVASVFRLHRFPAAQSFRFGLLTGLLQCFWFHGFLYARVPVSLASIPVLGHLPLWFAFLLVAALGAWGLRPWLRIVPVPHRFLHGIAFLMLLGGIQSLPHDLFRWVHRPPALPAGDPRVVILSVDALRQDTFERLIPGSSDRGIQAITAVPATRVAWNLLLGGDPQFYLCGSIAPTSSELRHPERLGVLAQAHQRGLRSAFAINDDVTLGFSRDPNLWSTVRDPEKGWKYYFSLGFASTWPAFGWGENYLSPVETINPWSSPEAFWRDTEALIRSHHFTAVHDCALHPPISLSSRELTRTYGWGWLGRSAYNFRSYYQAEQLEEDRGSRLGPYGDASVHYASRSYTLLEQLPQRVRDLVATYPRLSGVVTSDHGEFHAPILEPDGTVRSHINGMHGFTLDPDTVRIPLVPFGKTRIEGTPGSVVSWFDLRDGLSRWIRQPGPLTVNASESGWLVQAPYGLSPIDDANARTNGALDPTDIAAVITQSFNGSWHIQDGDLEKIVAKTRLATALVEPHGVMRLIVPGPKGGFLLYLYKDYNQVRCDTVGKEEADRLIQQFKGRRATPLPPVASPQSTQHVSSPNGLPPLNPN